MIPAAGQAANNQSTSLFPIDDAISSAQNYLLTRQHSDGFWVHELAVDATLCADWILYMHWSSRMELDLQKKCADHIRRRALESGGWNIYHGGPPEINATIKAYFALKLAGDSPDSSWMTEARSQILRLGGIPAMNTYSKLYLALLGQFPWDHLPAIPLEIMLFPGWFFFNLHKVSAWSRTMLVPLAIINHFKPVRNLPAHLQLHELYPVGHENADLSLPRDRKLFTWRNFFLFWNRALKLTERLPAPPWRESTLTRAKNWMIARMGDGSDGLGAIFPAMLNSIIALQCLGYERDHPLARKAEADMRGLFIDEPGDFRIQPCLSPVWDTAINLIALRESGVSENDPRLTRAVNWLVEREVRFAGDWSRRIPNIEPTGWAFEFSNIYYPDTDDTAMVLLALARFPEWNGTPLTTRATNWLLAFQCRGGGWGAFDRDVTDRWLEEVPFADHNAILDPECSDLTARVLEVIGHMGPIRPIVTSRAIAYLRRTQEPDGSWYGRWGVNYIYGTWQVLRGLSAFGWDMREPWLLRARDWLESCQNEDGSWGETAASYLDPTARGKDTGTASQTAWALMGLCAAHEPDRSRILRGAHYLLHSQQPAGDWIEPDTTGTGFPGVFYLRYDSYRINWPLLALAEVRRIYSEQPRCHPATR